LFRKDPAGECRESVRYNSGPIELDRASRERLIFMKRFFFCLTLLLVSCGVLLSFAWRSNASTPVQQQASSVFEQQVEQNRNEMFQQGKQIFRFDTFGDEAFWGGALHLHQAIAGERNGGVGPGVSPKTALSVGLKVDADALPADLVQQIKQGKVNLDDPATTLALLKLNAVVGLTGHLDNQGHLTSVGIQCAFCHSTVDDSFSAGIGHRLDGWANRDLNVGAIVALAPNLQPVADLLGVDVATVKKVLSNWGPGKYDAELNVDGKAARPDGKTGAVLIPPAFGLAGVSNHTWSGSRGSIPYWNAYVAVTQMHGSGTFIDKRLDVPSNPVAAKTKLGETRGMPDQVTAKLAALQYYQLSLPAPRPPQTTFDQAAAGQGQQLFNTKAKCATCHVPPLFTEPGWSLHSPEEIGIDDFQAKRSPGEQGYRTAPLRGLFTHSKGGFYHDGRFASLNDVVDHYNSHLNLGLNEQEKTQLVEYLKSL
jgi:mono/diheme cytochrome c family protein